MHRVWTLIGITTLLALSTLVSGCPKPDNVGVALIISPDYLDFGSGKSLMNVRVNGNFTTTPSEPLVVTSNAAWVVPEACANPSDDCKPGGIFRSENVPVRIRREMLSAGLNRAKLYFTMGPSSRKEVEVVAEDLLQVDFTADERSVGVGKPVQFRDTSVYSAPQGAEVTWLWRFGDGTLSTEQNPSHLYIQTGSFTVSLTLSVDGVEEVVSREAFVNVGSPEITADFIADNTNVQINQVVAFTDLSTSENMAITMWTWDFGDGFQSSERNPYHQYNRVGVYNVSLTVGTQFGTTTVSKPYYINVRQKLGPDARFTASASKVFVNTPVRFLDTSDPGTATITNWVWEFGDGVTISEQNPVHTYTAAGVYTVKLTVYTSEGVDSESLDIEVLYKAPTAEFDAVPVSPSVGEQVQFNDRSTPGSAQITEWLWNFGDGDTSRLQNPRHIYNRAGSYTVSLTVTTFDPSNNTDTIEKQDYILVVKPPVPDFEWTPRLALAGQRLQFNGLLSEAGSEPITAYAWDFDGNPDTVNDVRTGPTPTYTFTAPGTYTVLLKVSTPSRTKSVTKNVVVDLAPVAEFSATPQTGITLDDIQFTAGAQNPAADPVLRYLWNFGDGTTSSAQNPTHRYAAEGTYKVRLTLYFRHSASLPADADLSVFKEKTGFISITAPVPPVVEFEAQDSCAYTGVPVVFNITKNISPTRPIIKYEWDFGDGTVLEQTEPVSVEHEYAAVGAYEVSLTVTAEDLEPGVGVRTYILPEPISVGEGTPLDEYVHTDDGFYSFNLANQFPVRIEGVTVGTAYVLQMTSQQWRSSADVYTGDGVRRDLWTHNITVVDPKERVSNTAMLFIDGGSRTNSVPTTVDEYITTLAVISGTPIALVKNIPSQPIVFTDEVVQSATEKSTILRNRTEDAIIAYSYDKFMDSFAEGSPDYTWPLLFPMAKAAVKAMDTVETLMKESVYGVNRPVSDFVVAGASKRGWTTWLTGATDCRVKAIAPIVIDVLNMDEQMLHHRSAYGYWAPSIYDYAQERVFDKLLPESAGGALEPEALALLDLVDPYEYVLKGRYDNMPKFMMNGSGDQFFLPDSSQWYFDGLEGEKYLNYIPNAGHGLVNDEEGIDPTDSENPAGNLLGWYMAVTQNKTRPPFTWSFDADGSIRVEVDSVRKPKLVKMWYATSTNNRDFRVESGTTWTPQVLLPQNAAQTLYVGKPADIPAGKWTGFFVQLFYANTARLPGIVQNSGLDITVPDLVFTTGVKVLPQESDGSNLYPEFTGYIANDERPDVVNFASGKTPVVVLYGKPYEMGFDLGTLLAADIQEFIPNYVENYKAVASVTDGDLDADWANAVAALAAAPGDTAAEASVKEGALKALQELEGIAAGSGVSLTLLQRAQAVAMRDANEVTTSGGAGLAAWRNRTLGGVTLHGATNNGPDFATRKWGAGPAEMRPHDYDCVVVCIPERGVPHALFTMAGLVVGRTGVNLGGISFSEVRNASSSAADDTLASALLVGRGVLYNSLSLTEAVDMATALRPQRGFNYVIADGRNQLRGAQITIAPTGSVQVDYNRSGDFDTANPMLPGMVYRAGSSSQLTALRSAILPFFGALNEAAFQNVVADPAPVAEGRNVLNAVFNATGDYSLRLLFSFAEGNVDAAASPTYGFDLQLLLP